MDYKEKAQILRSCSGVNGHTCSSCPAFGKGNRTCRSNAMKDGANCIEILLARAESAELRSENAEKIVDEYAESARAIALWISAFCDKSMSYPQMISNAARKISVAYADMEKRAKCDEARIRELETQHRTEMCEAGYDCVELGKVRREKEDVEEIASNLCDDFTDFVTGGVYNAAPYCANKRPECVNDRGWCNGDNPVCRGFLPKAARVTEE